MSVRGLLARNEHDVWRADGPASAGPASAVALMDAAEHDRALAFP